VQPAPIDDHRKVQVVVGERHAIPSIGGRVPVVVIGITSSRKPTSNDAVQSVARIAVGSYTPAVPVHSSDIPHHIIGKYLAHSYTARTGAIGQPVQPVVGVVVPAVVTVPAAPELGGDVAVVLRMRERIVALPD